LHDFKKSEDDIEDEKTEDEIYGIVPVKQGVGDKNHQINHHSDYGMGKEIGNKFPGFFHCFLL
jgi:hypothetical protein